MTQFARFEDAAITMFMNHVDRLERLETVTLLIIGWLVLITGYLVWKEAQNEK